MRLSLSIAISLASLAPLATAFTLPEGLPDGNYMAYINATGHEVHVKVSEAAALTDADVSLAGRDIPARNPLLGERQDAGSEVDCGCGYNMNHGDCDNAVAQLKGQFPAYVRGWTSYYSIFGSVVAFLCAGASQVYVTPDGFGTILADITGECGLYVAGTYVTDPDFSRAGYMIYYGGLDFCAASTGSSAHSC